MREEGENARQRSMIKRQSMIKRRDEQAKEDRRGRMPEGPR